MRTPLPGAAATLQFTPGRHHTAAAIGNAGVLAVSTPAILGFIEETALEAIRPYQEPGEISVGVKVELDHVGPAFLGAPVSCRASIEDTTARRVAFAVEASQNGAAVARGRYVRAVLLAERFYASRHAGAAEPLLFWFDFHSPWSYLAASRLPAIAARHDRRIDWVPVHLARLIEQIGGRQPLTENAAFRRWYAQDLQDAAARVGLAIRYHPAFPLRPARALRAAAYAIDAGSGPAFVTAVMRAYWTMSEDISDLSVLGRMGAGLGLDAEAVVAATVEPRWKRAVEDGTSDAIARGVFGVPSVLADGKLFFGNDRLDLLDDILAARGAAAKRSVNDADR